MRTTSFVRPESIGCYLNLMRLYRKSLGTDWNTFVVDLMYVMYSSRRYANELSSLRLRYVVNEGADGQIRIVFSNCIMVDLQLPPQYPRVGSSL